MAICWRPCAVMNLSSAILSESCAPRHHSALLRCLVALISSLLSPHCALARAWSSSRFRTILLRIGFGNAATAATNACVHPNILASRPRLYSSGWVRLRRRISATASSDTRSRSLCWDSAASADGRSSGGSLVCSCSCSCRRSSSVCHDRRWRRR